MDAERNDRVAEVLAEIDGRGLRSVRLAFADVHGVLRGKTIRPDLVGAAFTDGVGITSALLLKDTGQNNVYPVWAPGGGLDKPWLTGAGDVMMLPDPATFRVLPWAERTGWLLCDVFSPEGDPIELSTRRLCATAEQALLADGVRLEAGLEIEFHLYHAGGDGAGGEPAAIHPGWMYLAENRYDSIEPLVEVLRADLTALGLPPRSLEVELGPSQVEMTFSSGSGLEVADQAVLIRSAVKQIARRHGMHATFMSRPHLPGAFTSGWHLHQSLVDTGTGANLFVTSDSRSDSVLSEPGRWYLAGVLAHAAESCLLTTPTVTGYKRYRPDSLAPFRASWGQQNRGAMARVIGRPGDPQTRIENRVGDSAANPYLYLASQMVCGRQGLQAKEEPPSPADSPYEEAAGPRLPTNLGQAVDTFAESRLYRSALGSEFVDYLAGLKRAEWNRFLATVTDWEHDEYFDLF